MPFAPLFVKKSTVVLVTFIITQSSVDYNRAFFDKNQTAVDF
jgi:hypothetical protein